MNSLKIKLKFKRFKPGGLWAELRAACQVYFVWAAMLAFGLGVALRELGVWALPAVGLPAALVLVGLAATAALLANRPVWLLPAFLLLGLVWSGLAELRLTSFAVPPDEAVFFRGRVVQVLEREENAFDALADAPRNGYSFVMQGEDQNGWRGRLLIVTAPLRPKAGDCLQVSGLVLDQSRTHNFSLSERDYLRSQSVAAAVRPVPQGLSFSRLAAPYSLPNLGLAVRQRVFAAMEPLPLLQQALLKGIGFGETGMLTNGQSSVLAQSGIMHLFAVSGLHVGYVTLLAAWLLRGLGRLLPLPGWLRFLVLVALVVFFCLVVGPTPSVLRAAVMTLAALLALAGERGGHSGCALILAAFLLLLWQPGWLREPGFLLSFLATAGILFTASWWQVLAPSPLLSVSLAAQFMIMPLLVYFFNTVSLVGLLASPFLLCGAGLVLLLILLAMPLAWLGLAYIPLAGAGLLAEWMYRGAELLANLPHAFVYALRPGWPALLLYYLLLAAALYCLARVKNAAWADEKI